MPKLSASCTRSATAPDSNRNLSSYLHHAPCRDLEEVGGITCRLGETNEELVLPERHSPVGRGPDRAPRDEERRRHDVEPEPLLAQEGQPAGDVWCLHVSVGQRGLPKRVSDNRNAGTLLVRHTRSVGGSHRQDHVLLVK